MNKEQIIQHINNYIYVLISNPELFHDGIDEELAQLLVEIKKYIESEGK